jgi:prepilin-type N-terminal cleavage/methylation domain-containing protein
MKTSRHSGFTLIELMIAVAILAIVSAIAVPLYNNYIREGRLGAMRQNLDTLRIALEDFRLESADGNYGAAGSYTTSTIKTTFGWEPDGDAGRYTYGARTTSATVGPPRTPASYDVWAVDPIAQVWLRCENRMNRCCDDKTPGVSGPSDPCP